MRVMNRIGAGTLDAPARVTGGDGRLTLGAEEMGSDGMRDMKTSGGEPSSDRGFGSIVRRSVSASGCYRQTPK